MNRTQYKTLFFFLAVIVGVLLIETCSKGNITHQTYMDQKDIGVTTCDYIISDSKIKEIEKTLSNYLRQSGMSENERREFIYDLCDTTNRVFYPVFFRYSSKINGYNVEGHFSIGSDGNRNYQFNGVAYATLYFSSDSLSFQIPHYTFQPSIEGFADSLKTFDCIEFEYPQPDFPNPSRITLDSIHGLPFAFVDINFDGEKELLLANPGNGQKIISTYRAYQLPEIEDLDPFEGYTWNCLDEWTEFDYTTNTVISSLWVGYDGSEKWYFKYDGDRLKPYRKEIYTHWFDSLKTSTQIP